MTLGYLKSGQTVLAYDTILKTINPDLLTILPEALSRIYPRKNKTVREIYMNRIVGNTYCVETTNTDIIVYGQRIKAKGHSRFVKNRKPKPCSCITVILKKMKSKPIYIAIAAYIGKAAPPEIWDKKATKESETFWKKHAFIWGSFEIEPESERAAVRFMRYQHVPEY